MRTKRLLVASPLVVGALVLGACSSSSSSTTTTSTTAATTTSTTAAASTTTMAGGDTAAPVNIVELAASNPDFTALSAAIETAGLTEVLSGPGPFTVFAPPNEAFEKLISELGITAEQLLADPNLAQILTYHVVPGKIMSTDLQPTQSVVTVEGTPVEIVVSGGTATINGIPIVATDIEASNGVIHVINGVLVPTQSTPPTTAAGSTTTGS